MDRNEALKAARSTEASVQRLIAKIKMGDEGEVARAVQEFEAANTELMLALKNPFAEEVQDAS